MVIDIADRFDRTVDITALVTIWGEAAHEQRHI